MVSSEACRHWNGLENKPELCKLPKCPFKQGTPCLTIYRADIIN